MNNLDAASLIKAGRTVNVPFQLAIYRDDGASSLIRITKILRVLPGRRIVAKAEDGDLHYLVKIFIGRGARRYANREIRGVLAIEDAGVRTPFFEWQGRLQAGGGEILAFEYIEDATSLFEDWRVSDGELRQRLMQGVIPELARLHESGVIQRDIHPENFLIQQDRVYTIDGGHVVRSLHLSQARSLDNLSLFLAQFQSDIDESIPALLALYESARGWPPHPERLGNLLARVGKHRMDRKQDYIAKAFRDCTRFACLKEFGRFVVCERHCDTPALREVINNPDQAISGGQLLKRGNSATVAMIESDQGPLVIKRYNIKSYGHLFTRFFRKSRAAISWANTFRLEFLGINTLKPVALIEERFGPFRGRAYFITQYVAGDDASSLIDRQNPEADVISIVEIINDMKAAGVSHGDLKASNFLLTEEGAVIIDLDSMQEHSRLQPRKKAQIKDRERFMRNWSSAPGLEKRFADLLESP